MAGTILVDSFRTIERTLATVDDALLFVDPLADAVSVSEVLALRERHPGVAIALYSTLDAAAMRVVVQLAEHGVTELVLFGFDDKPERVRQLVEEAHDAAEISLLPIERNLSQLPRALRRAIEDMYSKPRRFRSTLDLAAAAGMSRRAIFRHLAIAGFVSPRKLVVSARILRAHRMLSDHERSAGQVAKRLGYRSVEQLSQHFIQLVGCTASDIKKGAAPQDFAALVLRSLIARDASSVQVTDREFAGIE